MLTMTCDRCKKEKPLEDFEVGRLRAPLHSHELQALDRLRREPAMYCAECFRPASEAVRSLDRMLSQDGDTSDGDPGLDLLADIVDWFRRRGRPRS